MSNLGTENRRAGLPYVCPRKNVRPWKTRRVILMECASGDKYWVVCRGIIPSWHSPVRRVARVQCDGASALLTAYSELRFATQSADLLRGGCENGSLAATLFRPARRG